jgi:hypothetical protein
MADERNMQLLDDDDIVRRAADTLREPVGLRAGFDERVMGDIRDAAPARVRPLSWFVRPRVVRMSPLVGLAAAAAIAGVAVLVPRAAALLDDGGQSVPAPSTIQVTPVANDGTAIRSVQFVLVAPEASSVALAGSFNDWDTSATRLRRDEGGVWTVQLPLRSGHYTYSFLIDGKEWRADPAAPPAVDDDFGTPTSALTVGAGSR